jgi:hypothetical protein
MTAPADKGKKAKTDADAGEENEQIDGALVLSIEKLQEIQDELEKVRSEPILPRSRLFLGLLSLLLPAWWVVGARCCRIWQWGLGRSVGLSRIGRNRSVCGTVEFSRNGAVTSTGGLLVLYSST